MQWQGRGCGVFWDISLDGCPPSGAGAGLHVVRWLASLYGREPSCAAFGDQSLMTAASREGLARAGVRAASPVAAGAHGIDGENRSAMLVDVMAFALGTPPPATIVLLLAALPRERFDRALAVLRRCGYRLVLVRPAASPAAALDRACAVVHDWNASHLPHGTVPLCFKCGRRNCRRVHPRRCAALVTCGHCGASSHDTKFHAAFHSYAIGWRAPPPPPARDAAVGPAPPLPNAGFSVADDARITMFATACLDEGDFAS